VQVHNQSIDLLSTVFCPEHARGATLIAFLSHREERPLSGYTLRGNHPPALLTRLLDVCSQFSSGNRSRTRSEGACPFQTLTLFWIAVGCHPHTIFDQRGAGMWRQVFHIKKDTREVRKCQIDKMTQEAVLTPHLTPYHTQWNVFVVIFHERGLARVEGVYIHARPRFSLVICQGESIWMQAFIASHAARQPGSSSLRSL